MLLVNAVPIVGVLRFGWSVTNVLVLYWFENLLIAVCTATPRRASSADAKTRLLAQRTHRRRGQ